MDVLITGGAGFLGSYLCDHFVEQNHRVICFDNFVTGRRENIQHLMDRENFVIVDQDVNHYIDLEPLPRFRGDNLGLVLHFASPASPDDYMEHPIKTLKVGALGTHRTLGVAKRYDATFLLASTSEVYGDPRVHPQNENYWGNVNPIGYRGVYDEAKRFAEAMTMAYHRAHGLDTRIVRIFNTYGPRMRVDDGRVVPNFIRQALSGKALTVYGEGNQTRSFCYVEDLIRGLVALIESGYHQPVNLGNPEEMTILTFARRVIEITGSDSEITHCPLPEDDPQVREPDITRAREQLGWEPRYTLEEGLGKTVPYFREELDKRDEPIP